MLKCISAGFLWFSTCLFGCCKLQASQGSGPRGPPGACQATPSKKLISNHQAIASFRNIPPKWRQWDLTTCILHQGLPISVAWLLLGWSKNNKSVMIMLYKIWCDRCLQKCVDTIWCGLMWYDVLWCGIRYLMVMWYVVYCMISKHTIWYPLRDAWCDDKMIVDYIINEIDCMTNGLHNVSYIKDDIWYMKYDLWYMMCKRLYVISL